MTTLDLSQLDWTLYGWRPFAWRWGRSWEAGVALNPDVGPFAARVPASVQQILLEAGVIEDWNAGVKSRACEWVEHRHWEFSARVPAGLVPPNERIILNASGLDYSGWALVDGQEIGPFQGTLLPHSFDMTNALGDGEDHTLTLVFEEPPREQGQLGYTSQSRHFKPRYNYSWDWCPRIVPIGVWDGLCLETGPAAGLEVTALCTELAEDLHTGRITVTVSAPAPLPHATLRVRLLDGGEEAASATTALASGGASVTLENLDVEAWWPNGYGAQRLYTVEITAQAENGMTLWSCERRVGFKRVEWQACEGAPAGAEPWICVVNGKPVFLQGVNWVPPRAVYHDTPPEAYEGLIRLYADMGCTCLRVWGGGILEKSEFYDLCDAAGLMVWQEFPLSSSGIDNEPPRDGEAIATLQDIARSYIKRRAHHVSLLLWSGGNELMWLPETHGEGIPVDDTHPCIAAMRDVVNEMDPGHRFVATSASGPRETAAAADFGKGLHHDVHGPWGFGGFEGMDAWRAYWAKDDALFRSEVGMPGACDGAVMERHAAGLQVMPAEGDYWRHTAAWWTQWDRLQSQVSPQDLAAYVRITQEEQAEAYRIAASSCKGRFPQCGGFIIWMGHDCFPCPANNSVIDFEGNPKPAYFALREVFEG